ncbi:hypothetical protein Acsp01_23430 [Actinoplanes sp. NBRC 101535]|nr:hypothetical protein Acsp01_23430 [Actinoplanes sp. NBRC 101535]
MITGDGFDQLKLSGVGGWPAVALCREVDAVADPVSQRQVSGAGAIGRRQGLPPEAARGRQGREAAGPGT